MEPSHCRPARIGNAPEYLVGIDALVVADPYRGGVHKGYPRAPARAAGLQILKYT